MTLFRRSEDGIEITTALIDGARGNDFINRVNGNLLGQPQFSLDDPVDVAILVAEYFESVRGNAYFECRLGRAAAWYLQRGNIPNGDMAMGSLNPDDVIEAVARSVARSINESREVSLQTEGASDSLEGPNL